MRDWGTGVHWWGWLLGFTATAIFVGLVIWAIVALVSWAHHGGNGPPGPDRAGYARRPGALAGYAHRYRDAGYARHYAAAGRN